MEACGTREGALLCIVGQSHDECVLRVAQARLLWYLGEGQERRIVQPTIVGLLQHSRACVVLYCKLRLYICIPSKKRKPTTTKQSFSGAPSPGARRAISSSSTDGLLQ